MGTVKVAQGNIEIIIYKKMRRRKNINSISATEQCKRRGYYYSTYRTAPSRQNNFFGSTVSGSTVSGTVALNGSEYLELLASVGLKEADFPPIQAVQQHRLWQRVGEPDSGEPAVGGAGSGGPGRAAVETAIAALAAADGSFSMAGASWTNNLSWVEGYANVLEPMTSLSAAFHQHFDPLVAADPSVTQTQLYQQALLNLLLLETSCFRYWGQGVWTDYASEIHRRGVVSLGA